MIVIKSTDNQWSITTDKGTYSPAKGDLIEGISARPIRGSSSQDTATATASEFVVLVETTDIELTMSGATSAFVSNDKSVSQLTSTGSKKLKQRCHQIRFQLIIKM